MREAVVAIAFAQGGSPQSPSPKEVLETCIGGSGCESVLRRRLRRIDSPR